MTEAGIASFDECVEALKQFKGDENAACQHLIEKIPGLTKQWVNAFSTTNQTKT